VSAGAAVAVVPRPSERVRVITAASLFDGHDAAINIMRRLLQAQGAEVIHLGHDRAVEEIVEAAVQEDAHAVAVSSYQGGHLEYFRYLVDRLREVGAGNVRVYGGGGGTITPEEAEALHAYGVARIFLPEDGRRMGLAGMIRSLLAECAEVPRARGEIPPERLSASDPLSVARLISWFEETPDTAEAAAVRRALEGRRPRPPAPVVGFTGTGGAGKSSVVDELVSRFRLDFPERTLGILLVDPTRRRSGGALLGDRLRLNAIHGPGVFVRSLATRQANLALSRALADAVRVLQAADFDLILVETAGIGQSDSEIVDLADCSVYVMTPDYGAPSQLEKIDMLDLADFTVLNKFDRQGAEDALRDVRKQWRRNRGRPEATDDEVPVFPTVARRWNDPGTDRFYAALRARLFGEAAGAEAGPAGAAVGAGPLIPAARRRYLAEIAETVRGWRQETEARAERAGAAHALARALTEIGSRAPEGPRPFAPAELDADADATAAALRRGFNAALEALGDEERAQLAAWPETRTRYAAESQGYTVRDREVRVANHTRTLARTRLPKVALPGTDDWGALVRYFRLENLPGCFPFTAGVFPFKREAEDPTRMFAGEGGPERTNRRFHYLCRGQPAARLSTAFDSVTLYGRDPDPQPDVYGKVGNSGVSVCTVDDAKKLYSGFDLGSPTTSVSMTINGPAPTLLAFFLNAAIDQGVEKHLRETGGLERACAALAPGRPVYAGARPEGHDGLGLALLGVSGDEVVDADTYARIRADVLRRVRGTVQADILKEDQAQNTCIFSTDFSLQVMGDIQAWFIENEVRNFYSVSISGYHMAEAGANPITQLAFTLANGFTLCEYYAARGMAVDAFAPNFSFFFSNGLDAEYSVIGRVARRIWAVAMRERYGASERSQKLKYHIQTSGRSLHAREMAFNCWPWRTTATASTPTPTTRPSPRRPRPRCAAPWRSSSSSTASSASRRTRTRCRGATRSSSSPRPWRRRCCASSTGSRSAGASSARWRAATSAARSRTRASTTSPSRTPASSPSWG
jgi:methylmalonyl-CoA mutase